MGGLPRDPWTRPSRLPAPRGVGPAAVCLRWGGVLAAQSWAPAGRCPFSPRAPRGGPRGHAVGSHCSPASSRHCDRVTSVTQIVPSDPRHRPRRGRAGGELNPRARGPAQTLLRPREQGASWSPPLRRPARRLPHPAGPGRSCPLTLNICLPPLSLCPPPEPPDSPPPHRASIFTQPRTSWLLSYTIAEFNRWVIYLIFLFKKHLII